MRHKLEQVARNPLSWLRGTANGFRTKKEEFWALKDVDFDVSQGEVIGIIGRNGAGKSTLLKILSRITHPTTGRVQLRGRVSSLLEVGTGFHQELTGRENIFLNGAILGMTNVEIRRRFDEIVAFSEIEKFLDTPVKRYSSGMYVRLAFAVAAHLEPEILLVDEVLAVGDLSFQKKCLGKMGEVSRDGRTILFVSHNMEAVRTLCQKGVLLEAGRVRALGRVDHVVERYLSSVSGGLRDYESVSYGLTIRRVALKNEHGKEVRQFTPGEDLVVEVAFDARRPVEKPYFLVIVQGFNGNCFTANMLLDGQRPEALDGTGIVSCRFKSLPLLPQHYSVRMSIRAKDGGDMILGEQEVGSFVVAANLEDYGYRGEFLLRASTSTSVVVPYEWRLPGGLVAPVSLERDNVQAV